MNTIAHERAHTSMFTDPTLSPVTVEIFTILDRLITPDASGVVNGLSAQSGLRHGGYNRQTLQVRTLIGI